MIILGSGYLVYSFVAPISNTSDDLDSTEQIELTAGDFDGRTGKFQAVGYLYINERPEAFCENDCQILQQAFFYISETANDNVNEFIIGHKGNAFFDDSAVSLGCVEGGLIEAFGIPSGRSKMRALSEEDSRTLINSNETNMVSVELNRLVEPAGSSAGVCYSFFDEVIIL